MNEEYDKGFEEGYKLALLNQAMNAISNSLENIKTQIICKYGDRK